MSAGAIPWAFTAAITFAISAAFARRAADAVLASLETPNESCALSGTVATAPLPVTTIECWVAARVVPPAPAAPASNATEITAITVNDFIRLLYAANRTRRHTMELRPLRASGPDRDASWSAARMVLPAG